jgi:hypothetical protein
MPDLSSYPDVFNTCLVLIDRQGFKLSHDGPQDTWSAERDGYSFLADNPVELLGLTTIYLKLKPTQKAEYWWRLDEPNLLGTLDPEGR